MFKATNLLGLIPFSLLGIVFLVGCQPTTSYNSMPSNGGHDHAHKNCESYCEALVELDKLRLNIQTNFEEGTGEIAHKSIHDAGHILQEIPALAKKDGISGDSFEKVKAAAERAFEAFGKLDTFHGKDEHPPHELDAANLRYEKVADDIQSAFHDLHAQAPATKSDHEHGDDHEHGKADAHDDDPQANSTGQESGNQEKGNGQE